MTHRRGRVGQNRYALTFDDGPLPGATDAILDCLKSFGAPATFFVIGRFAAQWPELVRRMYAEGHVVANHSWDHGRWCMWRSAFYWRRQLRQTDAIVEQLIGCRPALFRPPYGVRTPMNLAAAWWTGHANIRWTRRAFDGVSTTADRIVTRLEKTASDGDVLVLHDGREPASRRDPRATIEALPRVIAAFAKRGLTPSPLHELLGIQAYRPRPLVPSPGIPGEG